MQRIAASHLSVDFVFTANSQVNMKTFKFEIIKNLFNKYPLGRAVLLLDGLYFLQVFKLSLGESWENKFYILKDTVDLYPYNKLVPFDPKDYPESDWVFFNEMGVLISDEIDVKYCFYEEVLGDVD